MANARSLFFLIVELAFAYTVAQFWLVPQLSTQVHVQVENLSSKNSEAQIFWRQISDKSYLESDSRRFKIKPGMNTLQTPIPFPSYFIRIDPLADPGVFRLHSICISYAKYNLHCWKENSEILNWREHYNIAIVSDPSEQAQLQAVNSDPQIEYALPSFINPFISKAHVLISSAFAVLFTFLLQLLGSPPLRMKLKKMKFQALGLLALISILTGGFYLWRTYYKAPAPVVGFTQGKAPVFIEHLYTQAGHPLTDKPGNFALMLDPFTIYRNFPNQNVFGLTTDKNGFRGSDWQKTPSQVGLVLGGSTAFGWRITNDQETIESYFSKSTGATFINMAAVSNLIGQELATLVNYGLKYKPNYVISVSGWNDFNENLRNFKRTGLNYNSAFEMIQDRLYRYYLSEYRTAYTPSLPAAFPSFQKVPLKDLIQAYFSYIEKLHTISKAYGAEYILVIQSDLAFKKNPAPQEKEFLAQTADESIYGPDYQQEYKDFALGIDKLCKKNGIKCVNMLIADVFLNSKDELYTDNVHLTPIGNRSLVELTVKSYPEIFKHQSN